MTPTGPEDITATWIQDVLRADGLDVAVEAVNIGTIGAAAGFIGQLHKVDIEYSSRAADAPDAVVVKMPTTEPGGRMIGDGMGMYAREAGFYRELAPDSPVRVPHCYANIAEGEGPTKYCLVIECLDAAPGDQVAGASLERSRSIVEGLAKVHAHYSPEQLDEHVDWLPTINTPSTTAMFAMYDQMKPVVDARFGDKLNAQVREWIDAFAPNVLDRVAEMESHPVALVHGDFRLDNLMFTSETDFTLLDWQMVSRSPGATDLGFYLGSNLDSDARRAQEDELIELYLRTLDANGGAVPTEQELRDWMADYLLIMNVGALVGFAQIPADDARAEALFMKMYQRGVDVALDWNIGRRA